MTGILENGTHQPSQEGPFFTEAFFIDPLEIRPFMAECGAVDLAMFGAEEVMAQSEDRLAGLSPEVRQGWLSRPRQHQARYTPASTLSSFGASQNRVVQRTSENRLSS